MTMDFAQLELIGSVGSRPVRPGRALGQSAVYVARRSSLVTIESTYSLRAFSGRVSIGNVLTRTPPSFFGGLVPGAHEATLRKRHGSGKGRERELRWLREHRNELQRLSGQWIVIEGQTLVASGFDPVEVVREARRKGVRVPFVRRIDESRAKGTGEIGL